MQRERESKNSKRVMFLYFFNCAVYETESTSLSLFYMNFHVKRLVWSRRKVIWLMPVTTYISQVFRIFVLKNQASNYLA